MSGRRRGRVIMAKRYQEAEVGQILQEVGAGAKIAVVCRKYGVSRTTVHRWRRKYPAVKRRQLERLKTLEAEDAYLRKLEGENARLRKIVAQQALDIDALQDLVGRRKDC